jgi:hypothetical protein
VYTMVEAGIFGVSAMASAPQVVRGTRHRRGRRENMHCRGSRGPGQKAKDATCTPAA